MKLEFRSWKQGDQERLAALANQKEVSQYLRNVFPYPYSKEAADDFIRFADSYQQQGHLFAVLLDGEVVGGANIEVGSDVLEKNAEIGYWLGRDYWGKGIGTWVVQELTGIGFREYSINRIYASIITENRSSEAILQKAGYQVEGRFRNHIYKRQRFYDSEILAILREEWES